MKKVISLTTIPPRFPHIFPTLKSLDDQEVDVVYLNLPMLFKRTGEAYPIPQWIADHPWKRLKVNFCEDVGPITKLIPTLDIETDPDTAILICDDDNTYGPGWSDTFFRKLKEKHGRRVFITGNGEHTTCIVGDIVKGLIGVSKERAEAIREKYFNFHFHFPECFSGMVAYRDAFNAEKLLQTATQHESTFHADDLVIGHHLWHRNPRVEMVVLGLDNVPYVSCKNYGMPQHSLAGLLRTGGNATNYMRAFPTLVNKPLTASESSKWVEGVQQT